MALVNNFFYATKIIKKVEMHKKAIIYRFFNKLDDLEVESIQLNNSEYEDDMQIVISFYEGEKLLYIDDSRDLEQCFLRYLSWFNNTITKKNPIYCKNILSYSDCSFVENIEEKRPSTEAEKLSYYYRLGCIIAIFTSLDVDIVCEKDIIKKESNPVVRNVERIIKKAPAFDINKMKRRETLDDALKYCPDEYKQNLQDGYSLIFDYIQENESDMWSLIKICFQER